MKKKLFLLLYISALTLSQGVYANGAVTGAEIVEIWAGGYSDRGVPNTRLYLATPHQDPGACASNHSAVVIYGGSPGSNSIQSEYYEQQFTLANAALMNGNPVSFYLSGCTEDGRFARAYRLSISR